MRTVRMVLALSIAAVVTLLGFAQGLSVAGPAMKNVVKFGVNRAAENLDPVTQDANPDIWAFMQIYQQLVRVNVKGNGFDPDLAERWTNSADGKTWTFFLRRNAKFKAYDLL